MSSVLEARRLVYCYPDGSRGLDDCSLLIKRGSRNALLGANGSGKTTLLKHFNALLRPTDGQVLFADQTLVYSRPELNELRRRVGFVFQNPEHQLFSASVFEDVSFGPLNLGLDNATVRHRVESALTETGMATFSDRPVHQLSHGQKKRVCIAGVLAMQPEVLLFDEPMAGLDAAMQADLLRLLEQLSDKGISIVLSTHDVDFAYAWADQIHLLQAGRCLASFSSTDLPAWRETMAIAGQPLPTVLEFHQHLVGLGLDVLTDQPPRSLNVLSDALAEKSLKFLADNKKEL